MSYIKYTSIKKIKRSDGIEKLLPVTCTALSFLFGFNFLEYQLQIPLFYYCICPQSATDTAFLWDGLQSLLKTPILAMLCEILTAPSLTTNRKRSYNDANYILTSYVYQIYAIYYIRSWAFPLYIVAMGPGIFLDSPGFPSSLVILYTFTLAISCLLAFVSFNGFFRTFLKKW